MNQFIIPEDILKWVLNYLSQRPYIEVAKAVSDLQQLEIVQDSKD